MKEIKNTEVAIESENNEVVAIPEEKKDGIVKRTGKWIKKNGLKVVALGAVGLVGYLFGKHASGNSEDCNCDESDVIEAEDYTVEDAE